MEPRVLQNKQLSNGDLMSKKHMISAASTTDTNERNIEQTSKDCPESQTSGSTILPEECEKLILSPPPVPLNLEAAAAAIYAAQCRSSRTHSVNGSTPSLGTVKCEDHRDISRQSSVHDLQKSHNREAISSSAAATDDSLLSKPPGRYSSRWRTLFCCFSAPPDKSLKKSSKKKTKSKTVVKKNRDNHELPVADDDSTTNDPVVVLNFVSGRVSAGQAYDSTESNGSPNGLHNGQTKTTYGHIYVSPVDNGDDKTQLGGTNEECLTQYVIHQQPTGGGKGTQQLNWMMSGGEDGNNLITYEQYPQHLYPYTYPYGHGQYAQHYVQNQYTVHLDPSDGLSDNVDSCSPGVDLLGELQADCANKKCLVLDLDETLVHSSFKFVKNADCVVPVEINGTVQPVYVRKRPYLDEFLKAIGPLFECVMFTASLRKYADPVCNYIDTENHFKHRLFREACVDHQSNLIKDLSRLGRNVDQVCIVDNSPISFLFQPQNALQIVSWFGDTSDQALADLIPYLTDLASTSLTVHDYMHDVRPPQSAAIAQPPTPSCLLLFNHQGNVIMTTSSPVDEDGELDDSDDGSSGYSDKQQQHSNHVLNTTATQHLTG